MVIARLVLLFVFVPGLLCAQKVEFRSVKRLPTSINTVGEETLPLMSPDGRELFFARALYAGNTGGKFSGLDAWATVRTEGGWKNPSNQLPGYVNTTGHNAIVGISSDGTRRYFLNAKSNERMAGIYVSTRVRNSWSRPELVPIPGIENQNFIGVFVSPDFDVILLSMKAPDSRGEEDLYFCVRTSTGEWSAPKGLGATINTPGFEISPFLSADKKRLYFASDGHGGEGGADIFYSDRLYNSWETWSVPVNLGKEVNSPKFDAYFSIYGDTIAFLASNRDGRFADLYEVGIVPARSILKEGQRYLSRSDWNRLLGGTVSNEIVFESRKTTLTSAQQELLFYIANKLQLSKTILFHLVVTKEEDEALREPRLKAIIDYLAESGISEQRILVEQVGSPAKDSRGTIDLRLIE